MQGLKRDPKENYNVAGDRAYSEALSEMRRLLSASIQMAAD